MELIAQVADHIRKISPYVPGKPTTQVARELDLDPTSIVKLASNENPLGMSPLARQAVQLGYLPRMEIRHTSETEIGQIYIPQINWILCAFVLALVVTFQSSSNLAAAYGVSVSGEKVCTR